MKTCGSCGQLNLVGPPLRLSCIAPGCGVSLGKATPATVREPDHSQSLRAEGTYRTPPTHSEYSA